MTDVRAAPEGAPKPGEIFAEKYRIERVLGIGGMGYVLAATHLQLDQRVAIKMLLPERARSESTVARFLQEGRAAVKIRSEHVARVLDVGSWSETPYIVMEYLDGVDLAELLRVRARLPCDLAVDYVLQACEAIAQAHALQIVHRDLKPANLFLVRGPDGGDCVKVLDFGISKIMDPESNGDDAMTKTSSTIGTPLYMSPEQLRSSKHVDARADIWSLGVILFELCAGRPPVRAGTLAELGAKVLTQDAPNLRRFVPDAPERLATAIARALERETDARFFSVAELASAIAPCGPPTARASAERIAQLVMHSPPSSARRLLGGDVSSTSGSVAPAGTQTDGTWATSTGDTARGSASENAPRRQRQRSPTRGLTRFVVGGFAVAVVGVLGGLAVARLTAAPGPTRAASTNDPATPALASARDVDAGAGEGPPPPSAAAAAETLGATSTTTASAPNATPKAPPKAAVPGGRSTQRSTSAPAAAPARAHTTEAAAPAPAPPAPPTRPGSDFAQVRHE